MAIIFVDSAGSNTSPYDLWSKAAADITTAIAAASAGDEIRVISTHSNANGTTLTYACTSGTKLNPIRIVSVTKGAADAGTNDTYTTGAEETALNAGADINVTGNVEFYGLTLRCADNMQMNGTVNACTVWIDCTIQCYDILYLNSAVMTLTRCVNCTFTDNDSGSVIYLGVEGNVHFQGCTITYDSRAAYLIQAASDNVCAIFDDCDFSGTATGASLNQTSSGSNNCMILRRCYMPSGWISDSKVATYDGTNSFVLLENCDDGTNTTRLPPNIFYKDMAGRIEVSTTSTRTSGGNDGETDWSIKMISNSDCDYDNPLVCPIPIEKNVAAGSSTVNVHVASDSDVNDKEFYLRAKWPSEEATAEPPGKITHLQVSGTAGLGSGSPVSDESATTLARDSGATWSGADTGTDGGAGQQIIALSISPTEAGVISLVPVLTETSKTLYVCPKLD